MMAELSALDHLIQFWPPAARKELVDFISYLRSKYPAGQPGEVVHLGGLWSDIPLDLDDEEVRALRQQVTRQLLGKV
jgi:hypothetical protein